ncbi:DUF669 domain-containing protein [Collinsella vaginalis]|uniref:DUF669 domain-containing protein n=1 Tax=Collinsella vaginalis TaxID=1870987 RepID=UPI000A26AD39|nr:DUF669 domain-containing protein [Collinsella vaginalis]
MADVNDLGQALGFDDEIEVADEFEAVAPGEYGFEVDSVERGQFNGSAKMAACPTAKVRIHLTDGGAEGRVLFDDLKLNTKMAWAIARFFVAVGMRAADAPSSERLKLDWAGAVGRRGRVLVKAREYNGRTYNDIEWLKPEPASQPAPSPMPAPPAFRPQAAAPVPPSVQAQINRTFQQGGAR